MARNIGPVTATSASWKVMARAWRTTRAPILISFSCGLVNDQSAIASGSLDLSHVYAAPSARLGHLAFESQGAFACQC